MRKDLLQLGLQPTEVTEDEFQQARIFRETYRRLSMYDAIALAIAKVRNWVLLTGDKPLREAAGQEAIECHGVIWIYDELRNTGKLSAKEYCAAINDLIDAVSHGLCRLPMDELRKRQGSGI